MTHQKEIIRYAHMPDETRVWYKAKNREWRLGNFPSWDPDVLYAVDDEHAQIRRAILDGHLVQSRVAHNCNTEWVDYNLGVHGIPPTKKSSNLIFKIKPRTVKVHQYLCRREDTCDYKITNSRYENIQDARDARQEHSGWIVVKPILESAELHTVIVP